MARLIVDGMNVIGSRPTGWWRDRPGAARRLLRQLQDLAAGSPDIGDELILVLDGRPLPDAPEGRHDGVLVLYARRGGPDAADDRIVEEVARDAHPEDLARDTPPDDLARDAPPDDLARDPHAKAAGRDGDPSQTLVITSDRDLRDRLTRLGARVEGAGALLRRLDDLDA